MVSLLAHMDGYMASGDAAIVTLASTFVSLGAFLLVGYRIVCVHYGATCPE